MKALDTSVLVRFLVKDDVRQAKAVYREFKQAENNRQVLFIPVLVILETIWVLESVYEVGRQEIIDSIDELMLMPILEFEAQSTLRKFIFFVRENNADLSDALIAQYTIHAGCDSVVTFDKRAAKIEIFELLY